MIRQQNQTYYCYLACCFLLLVSFTTPAQNNTSKKVALIIGNSNYEHVQPLINPVNDAEDLTQSFKQLGFSVTTHYDLNRRQMNQALQTFEQQTKNAELAVIYYGGHGVQLNGNNYLLPTDIYADHPDDIIDESISLQKMLAKVTQSKVAVAFIDACRDNPFKTNNTLYRSIFAPSETRGLARTKTATNIAVLYSAAPGQKALDGEDRNSVFVTNLKTALTSNLEFDDIVRSVGTAVMNKTKGNQEPYIEKSAVFPRLSFGNIEPNQPQITSYNQTNYQAKTAQQPTTTKPRLVNNTGGSLWNFLTQLALDMPMDEFANSASSKPLLERIAFGTNSNINTAIEGQFIGLIQENQNITGHEIIEPIKCTSNDPKLTINAKQLSQTINLLTQNLFTITNNNYSHTLECNLTSIEKNGMPQFTLNLKLAEKTVGKQL